MTSKKSGSENNREWVPPKKAQEDLSLKLIIDCERHCIAKKLSRRRLSKSSRRPSPPFFTLRATLSETRKLCLVGQKTIESSSLYAQWAQSCIRFGSYTTVASACLLKWVYRKPIVGAWFVWEKETLFSIFFRSLLRKPLLINWNT